LYNNVWGTNYVMWYPYRKEDANLLYRFRLNFSGPPDPSGLPVSTIILIVAMTLLVVMILFFVIAIWPCRGKAGYAKV